MKDKIILCNFYLHDTNINEFIKRFFNVSFILGRENIYK